jgi:hypothetical protein
MQNHKIEAVIVAFNYLDFLSITLLKNLEEIDHIIIVTKENDEIIEYCRSLKIDINKLTVITTQGFHFQGAKFNKGLVINLGFQVLKYKDWVITMDGDVILPKDFKLKFIDCQPNVEYFYGMRRYNIDTKKDFDDLNEGNKKLTDFILYRGSGYGYFSMFNWQSTIYQKLLKSGAGMGYPFWIKEARDIDWMFRNSWGERVFNPPLGKFPECHLEPNNDYDTGLYKELPFHCIHLGMPGMNHEKRETEIFK